jgi:hypothetical protein
MADRVNEVGAVHRVEVKIGHAPVEKVEHLFGSNSRRDQFAGRRVMVETLEAVSQRNSPSA